MLFAAIRSKCSYCSDHIRLLFLIRTEKESNSQLRLNRLEITEFEKLIISSFYYRLRILAVSN